jgi:hypothetical protein
VTNAIENERWRVVDRAADLLSVDREACRKSFHQEPEEHVREAVGWALSERNLPGHDPERNSQGWARERDAGVYGENGRRGGGLEHVESIVARSVLGRYAAAS